MALLHFQRPTPNEHASAARLEWGAEAMHWLLDIHFGEDYTQVWDMDVQKILNIMRKIALNLVHEFKDKSNSKFPISGVSSEISLIWITLALSWNVSNWFDVKMQKVLLDK